MSERTDPRGAPDREDGPGGAVELSVPDMDCPSCAGKVTNSVGDVPGVANVEADPTTGRLHVEFAEAADERAARDAVERAGYTVAGGADEEGDDDSHDAGGVWRSERALRTAVGAVLLAVGLIFEFALDAPVVTSVLDVPLTAADVAFVLATLSAGTVVVRNGYYSLRNRNLDIDLLMGAAIVAATGIGLFVEAATLAVLFSVAELLERRSVDRARASLRELVDMTPEEATVKRVGGETVVPVAEVRVGDVLVVRPGERIAADGVVVEGDSAVDQSPITGESVPVDKSPGDEVYAGTIVEGGYLEVEATAEADDSTLSRIVDYVEDAQRQRTEREEFVDRFSRYYTPTVVAAALAAMVVPPLAFGASWLVWFRHGIALLVIACPCAFVISTPVTVVSGVTSAARNGVLVKGGIHLETLGEVDAVAFDKTGTLTTGDLEVTDVVPLNGHTEADVLACARGLESRSEHPIGRAIVGRAGDAAVEAREPEAFEALAGRGVRASIHGETHYAAKPAVFTDLGFDLDHVHAAEGDALAAAREACDREDCLDLVEDTIPSLRAEGKTVVLVGTEDELEGVIAVADAVRPEAREAVARLREAGVTPVMLTGDNEGAARAVAADLGIEEVRAGLLPEEKVAAVESLVAEYGTVAMVGDGVNDAPALAAASVGIAMGAAGTDAAIETADVALLGDDLSRLPYLLDLSRKAVSIIRQNVWASLGVKALLAVGVPLGFVNVAVAVVVGDAGMTTAVTSNAMRLARLRPGN